MTLMLSNGVVEKLLTMQNCMDALEYAYGELARDQAVMGPVMRTISPLPAGVGPHLDGWQLLYASMAATLPSWMWPPTARIPTCSITGRPQRCGTSRSSLHCIRNSARLEENASPNVSGVLSLAQN